MPITKYPFESSRISALTRADAGGKYVGLRRALNALVAGCLLAAVAGCGTLPVARTDGHLKNEDANIGPLASGTSSVPQPVRQVPLPPPPIARVEEVKYSVTVNNVPVQELLFAISRDTKVNIDIHPDISGRVTLNAIDQTLKQILTRISKQVDVRWEIDGPNIVVKPDSPYLKIYRVDYVNMQRDSTSSIGVQTQVIAPAGVGAGGGGGAGQNSSIIRLENTSKNKFWETLEKNIKDMLRETDKLLPEGSSETFTQSRTQGVNASNRPQTTSQSRRTTGQTTGTTTTGPGVAEQAAAQEGATQTLTFREAASVIMNSETGTLAIRATSRQHETVGEFIEQISGASRRQVLIEATVVEVTLNDAYQSGVDWSALGLQGLGYTIKQNFTSGLVPVPSSTQFFSLSYRNPNAAAGGDVSSTVKLLNSFGNTRVLSSPKIMTLNNQSAVMRVVKNSVYFTVKTTPGTLDPNTQKPVTAATYDTTPQIVPEGFIMSVTPQISENDVINLSVRPSVTRITGTVDDPNPALTLVPNKVPVVETREFEAMLRIASGQTAVLGGLMQDSFTANRDGLPILSRIPVVGDWVSYRNDAGKKTELVVFIRALVIREASVDADLSDYKKYLPDAQFFKGASPAYDPMKPGTLNWSNPSVTESEPRKAP